MKTTWKRNTFLFLFSQTISLFGSALVQYAITWYITLTTRSGIMMTIAIICGFVPAFFLSPFAGVWADRYNRKNLIMLSDSMIALSTLMVAVLFLAGFDSLWLLFVASSIRAIGTGIQNPAVGAFLPQIVPEDKLTRINAVNGSIQSVIMLVSPMISGALLSCATIEAIFFIDVVTAAIAVFILFAFLKCEPHAKALENQQISYYSDLKTGFSYIKNHAYVNRFFIFCAFFFFLAAPAAFLTPLQVTRSFGDEVWRLTAIEITFSLGMTLGGVIMASWGGFKNKVHSMAVSSLIIGASTFALGMIPVFWIYLIFMGLIGIALPLFNIPSTVLLQQKVEEEFLGRVFGVLGMISTSMMPLGMLVFGPLSDMFRIEGLLILTGMALFMLSFFLIWNKILVEAGKPVVNEPEA